LEVFEKPRSRYSEGVDLGSANRMTFKKSDDPLDQRGPQAMSLGRVISDQLDQICRDPTVVLKL
jgi:hypothetical protein